MVPPSVSNSHVCHGMMSHKSSFSFLLDTDPFYLEMEVGGSANITCTIYPAVFRDRPNSSSLYFVEEDTNRRIPSSDIYVSNSRIYPGKYYQIDDCVLKVADDTTIVLMLRNAVEQDRNYICKSGSVGIGIVHVIVGK